MTATVASPSLFRTDRTMPRFAWLPVFSAMGALLLLLGSTANGYGYERDELYFRMLPPAWGYVDQPPLTPLIAHATLALGDEPWGMHVPAILLAVASVAIVALITREWAGKHSHRGSPCVDTALGHGSPNADVF